KLDKQTWRVKGTGTIKISYASYWEEAGRFASQLNSEHAFINPAMIRMYVAERRAEAVRLAMPDVPAGWLAAGAIIQLMESMGGARMLSGNAESDDALVDAPIEAGKFDMFPLSGIQQQSVVVV